MLRRLAFPCFPRYTLYPQFLVNDLGNLNFPFLRRSMFKSQQQAEGYSKDDHYQAHWFISDLHDPQEQWWMFVDIKLHPTLWSYLSSAYLAFCDGFELISDIATHVMRAEIQLRLLGAATWFATIEWFRSVHGCEIATQLAC